jgi:hypothetical protein
MIPLNQPCICGKTWVHCKRCGSSAVYALRNESRTESARAGYTVEVYNCKVCPHKTKSTDPCRAPSSAQVEQHKKVVKLIDHDAEIEPGVDLQVKPAPKQITPVPDQGEPGTMTLADLINRKEPSPEDGSSREENEP